MAAPPGLSWDALLAEMLGPAARSSSPPPDEDDDEFHLRNFDPAPGSQDLNVSQEMLESMKEPKLGHAVSNHVHSQMGRILALNASDANIDRNEAVKKVSGFYLENGRTLHCSKAAIGQLTQTPPHLLESTLVTVVNGMMHLDKFCRAQVERACTQGKLLPLLYIDSSRYDETPMKVRVKEVLTSLNTADPQGATFAAEGAEPQAPSFATLMSQFFTQTSAMCKLFATDNKFAILLKSQPGPEEGDSVDPEYLVVQGPSLTHLQCLERATGGTLMQGLLENLSVSDHVAGIPFKVRSTCIDEAGSNKVAEAALLSSLGPTWHGLHFPCNVHKVARTLQKTMDLVSEHIAGLLHFALALETSTAMSQFRQALLQVISSRTLVIRHGTPPAEAVAYREFILRLFGKSGSKLATRRYLLSTLLNGDWRKRDVIEVFVPAAFEVNRADLQAKITEGTLLALTSKVFSKYPRHRWLGCDVATDEVGLLESIHGLGSAALAVMQQGLAHPRAQRGGPPAAVPAREDPNFGLGSTGEPEVLHPDEAEDDEGPSSSMAAAQPGPAELSARNARYRRQALQWLKTDPLESVMLLRMCMSPLVELLTTYISRAGQSWLQSSRAQACEQRPAGQPEQTPISSLYEYVKLTAEQQFFESLKGLTQDPDWDRLPATSRCIRFQALAFCMTSRMGALVHQLLCLPARQCPYALLAAVDGEDILLEVQAKPPCLMDDFTKAFLRHFAAGPDFDRRDLQMCLQLLLERSHCDTVQVEWGHGRVNRLISVQKAHTHAPRLEYVNAQFVAQKHLERRLAWMSAADRKIVRKRPSVPSGVSGVEPRLKRARTRPAGGGGGAWRAFLSSRTKGQLGRVDFSQLKDEYRTEKAANSQLYQQWQRAGSAATRKHKLSKAPSFGPSTRSMRRKALTSMQPSRAIGGQLQGPLTIATTIAAERPFDHLQIDLKKQLTEVRRLALAEAKQRRLVQQRCLATLADFVSEKEADACAAALVSLPQLRTVPACLHLVPQPGLQKMEVVFLDDLSTIQNVASWITEHSRSNNFQRFLAADWTSKNRPLLHAAAPEPKDNPSPVTPCLHDGYCTCQPHTRGLVHIRKMLHQAVKTAIKTKLLDKAMLQAAYVCVELLPTPVATTEEDEGWTALLDDFVSEPDGPGFQFSTEHPTWLHIALQYLSPFRMTYQLLEEIDSDRAGHRCLQQTGTFMGEGEVAAAVSQDCTWQLQLHQIISTAAPLVQLRPTLAYVEKLASPATSMWPPPTRGRKRGSKDRTPRARRPRQSGKPDNEDDLDLDEAQQASPCDEEGEEFSPGHEEMGDWWASDNYQDQGIDEADVPESDLDGDGDPLSALLDEYMGDLQDALAIAEADAEEGLEASLAEVESMMPDPLVETPHPEVIEEPAPELAEPLPASPVHEAAAEGPAEEQPTAAEEPAEAPPRMAPQPRGGGARLRAECVVTVPGGAISYYGLKDVFQATCSNRKHGRCVLTRRGGAGARASQGRPLGLLSAWLSLGEAFETKQEHWDRTLWPDAELRAHHRDLLSLQPLGATLLNFERVQREDEGPEPEECP